MLQSHLKSLTFFVGALVILALAFNPCAQATNGYFSHGYGVQSKSMAGVAAALPRDAFVTATNPAGMVGLGNRYDIGFSLFNPNRSHTVTGTPSGQMGTFPLTPGSLESGSTTFIIPGLAANWMLSPKTSLGVTIYGNGGMNTDWDAKVYNNPMAPVTQPTGINLIQLFVSTTLAQKLSDKHSAGIAGIFAYQRFEAKGLQAFGGFSEDGTKLTDNDASGSNGFGLRIGYLGEPINGLHIGGSYQTKIFMTEFDEYAGLFAEKGDFDIPATWTAGIAVDLSRTLTLAADIQQIFYSDVKSIANPMNPANFQQGVLLGNENGSGFGWEDMTVFKFGLEWEGIVDMPLRLGYSFSDQQPIPEDEMMFNILAPGVIEQHLTFGFSRKMCGGKELSFSVMRAFSNKVSGPNPMEVPGTQTIDLEMDQWEFSLGFSF
ncbi:MAG: outer membrane protein transport protein [candidate division Zixibacteria bacterium]|nr:outer membrane protein transport protein [candidate division Zixibacteria bacterium]